MIVSIVVPVFNAEKYLQRLMDSLLGQTFLKKNSHKLEIILVNNNSTDASLKIIRGYTKKYPKIVKVYQCKPAGAAAVRNFGIKKATGKYVWFVDADDEVALTAVEKLVARAEITKAELVMMSAEIVDQGVKKRALPAIDENAPDWRSRFIIYGMGPWQVFFRRDWWNKCGWKFKEGIIHEDMEMMPALVLKLKKYASVQGPLYIYYQNEGSVLRKKDWDEKYFDIFPALEGLIERFGGYFLKYQDELEWFFIWNLLIDSARQFCDYKEGIGGVKRCREMLKTYFPHWRKNRFLKKKDWKFRLKIVAGYWGLWRLTPRLIWHSH